MKIISIALLFVIIALSSCGTKTDTEVSENTQAESSTSQVEENTETNSNPNGLASYTAEWLVSISYPEDWIIQEGFMGTVFVAASPVQDVNDNFSESINFLTQSFSDVNAADMDEYLAFNLEQMEVLFTDFEVVWEEAVNIAGLDGKKVTYQFAQWELLLNTTQYMLDNNSTAYIFTITHLQESPDLFEEEFNTILNSIQIL